MAKYKNITRMEYKPPFGWMVRIQYNKKKHEKFFKDSGYGGKSSSLLAAMAWRDKKKKELGMPNTHLHVVGSAKSNTGVCGVSFSARTGKYYVSWNDAKGHPCRTAISVRKHGKEKAFQIACQIRKEREAWRLAGYVMPEHKKKGPMAKRNLRKYTKEELLEILKSKYTILGRVPTSRDFKKTSPSYHHYETAFGGWNKALYAAGLRKPQEKR